MAEREWKLGDRVRTTFDGEVFPGVWEIVGIGDGQAQLESDQETRTWSPLEDLVPAYDAPPPSALPIKHTNQIVATAQLIASLYPKRAEAALTLLKSLICIDCGIAFTENHPTCDCKATGNHDV